MHPRLWPSYTYEKALYFIKRIISRHRAIVRRLQNSELLFFSFQRAIAAYNPRKYPGRIAIIVSSERVAKGGEDPGFGWSTLADKLELRTINSAHSTMLEDET